MKSKISSITLTVIYTLGLGFIIKYFLLSKLFVTVHFWFWTHKKPNVSFIKFPSKQKVSKGYFMISRNIR